MRNTLRATTALAAVLLAGATVRGAARASDDDDHDGRNRGPEFSTRLSGANEVPPVDTDTTGKAEISFNADQTKMDFELSVRKGVRVTQSHIHCAPKGVNGPVVVFLAGFHNRGWDVDGRWVQNATATDDNVIPPAAGSTCPVPLNNLRDLVAAIKQGNAYVNVHTVAHPGGEARGQLQRDDDDDDH
jgi:CHRD domain